MKNKLILLFFLLSICNVSSKENNVEKRFNIGAGWGGPYGFMGGNVDVNLISNLHSFVGLGIGPNELPSINEENSNKLRWAVGFRYHFLSWKNNFRPRATIYYGVNSYQEHKRIHESGYILGKFTSWGKGLSLGGGFLWMWFEDKRFGMDMDFYYALITDSYFSQDAEDKYYPIIDSYPFQLSLGLRYAF